MNLQPIEAVILVIAAPIILYLAATAGENLIAWYNQRRRCPYCGGRR